MKKSILVIALVFGGLGVLTAALVFLFTGNPEKYPNSRKEKYEEFIKGPGLDRVPLLVASVDDGGALMDGVLESGMLDSLDFEKAGVMGSKDFVDLLVGWRLFVEQFGLDLSGGNQSKIASMTSFLAVFGAKPLSFVWGAAVDNPEAIFDASFMKKGFTMRTIEIGDFAVFEPTDSLGYGLFAAVRGRNLFIASDGELLRRFLVSYALSEGSTFSALGIDDPFVGLKGAGVKVAADFGTDGQSSAATVLNVHQEGDTVVAESYGVAEKEQKPEGKAPFWFLYGRDAAMYACEVVPGAIGEEFRGVVLAAISDDPDGFEISSAIKRISKDTGTNSMEFMYAVESPENTEIFDAAKALGQNPLYKVELAARWIVVSSLVSGREKFAMAIENGMLITASSAAYLERCLAEESSRGAVQVGQGTMLSMTVVDPSLIAKALEGEGKWSGMGGEGGEFLASYGYICGILAKRCSRIISYDQVESGRGKRTIVFELKK